LSKPPVEKKLRRGPSDIAAIKAAIFEALQVDRPMTVRQVFYRLVSSGVIAKSEAEYKTTVVRLLGEMRRAKEVPFGWISDNTRWMRRPRCHDSLEAALRNTAETYRRSLWNNQGVYVEIWLEKDALAGVLFEVTEQFDVPLMVTRGYPSLSYLHSAAEALANVGKPAHLFYFGDHDPSGCDITRAVEDGIREFAPGADLTFSRVAVTLDQIADLGLATRPTKATDSRSRGFEGESVEVDAIPPGQLRDLAYDCIVGHIDIEAYRWLKTVEVAERDTLKDMAFRYETMAEYRASRGEEP
jgi:hypothetical protein